MISAPHLCQVENKTNRTEWLDGLLGLWELCLCVCVTHKHMWPRLLSSPIAWSVDAQIATHASISQGSLSLSQTKPAKIKEQC